jgi:AcrR family transcriptional regulator
MTDERARIREAMLEVVVEHGYEAATVDAVLVRGDLARADFERHFADFDECYLQLFAEFTDEFDAAILSAWERAGPWRERLRAAAYAAATYIRDHPRESAFSSTLMFAAGDVAQAHRERHLRRLTALIDAGREEMEDPNSLSPAVAEGVVGSIYALCTRKLAAGEAASVVALVPELMYVAVRPYLGDDAAREELAIPPPLEGPRRTMKGGGENIRAQKGQGERGAAPHVAMLAPVKKQGGGGGTEGRLSRLPPGRHGLSREFVSQNQRDRISAAIIAAVAERGYRDAKVSDITAAAGLSRRTFYTYFTSKAECFFATFDMIADHLRLAAATAAEPYEEWPDRVRARLGAVLDVFAANPDLARYVLIAPPRAGDDIAARYRQAMDEVLAELLEGMPPELAANQPSRAAEHALIGGGAALVVRKVEAGGGDHLPDLLPDLVELTLTPFLGRDEALRLARRDP